MQREPLITFIVPAYCAAATLAACTESILSSKDDRIELILAENGGDPATVAEIDRIASAEPERVRAVHTPKGVSNARNGGIEAARGKWLCFVDADDAIVAGGMDVLLSDAKQETADLILYGHTAGDRVRPVVENDTAELARSAAVEALRVRMLKDPTRYMQAWAKLIRRSVVEEHALRFRSDLRLAEDSDFILRLSRECGAIALSPACVYRYTLSYGSVMRSADGGKAKDYALAMRAGLAFVQDESEAVRRAFNSYILMHLNIVMVREVFAEGNGVSKRARLELMKAVQSEPVFSEALKRPKWTACRDVRLLPSLLLKLHCNALAAAAFTARAKQNARREAMEEGVA